MGCRWSPEGPEPHWSLLPHEQEQLRNKNVATRLGSSALLEFFRQEGHFPEGPEQISGASPCRLVFAKRRGKITGGKAEPLSLIDPRAGEGGAVRCNAIC